MKRCWCTPNFVTPRVVSRIFDCFGPMFTVHHTPLTQPSRHRVNPQKGFWTSWAKRNAYSLDNESVGLSACRILWKIHCMHMLWTTQHIRIHSRTQAHILFLSHDLMRYARNALCTSIYPLLLTFEQRQRNPICNITPPILIGKHKDWTEHIKAKKGNRCYFCDPYDAFRFWKNIDIRSYNILNIMPIW